MKSPTEIPVAKLEAGIRLALENARRLAEAAGNAARADDTHAAAVLLYQAAEEVGKAKLLKDHLDRGIPVATNVDFVSHSAKFRLAVQVLPGDCLELWAPAFDPAVFDPAFFQTDPINVDWRRRQESLYLNWNPSTSEWEVPAKPDRRAVRNSADRMVAFTAASLSAKLL